MKVAFRVDASPVLGHGHFMRCLSLADRLREEGASIRFVSRELSAHLCAMVAKRGYEISLLRVVGNSAATVDADAAATAETLGTSSWDWIVVDHYSLDARWEGVLRRGATRLLVIDDLADRTHTCDVLLDQNLHPAIEERYTGRVPRDCLQLLGPGYALVRQEFRRLRPHVTPRTGPVTRVAISFGGGDVANVTRTAIEALVVSAVPLQTVDVIIGVEHAGRDRVADVCRRYGFRCHEQATNMAELLAAADLAIGAGGISTWERCCVGLPTLAVSIAANQRPVLDAAARHGVLFTPGDAVTAASLARHIRTLASSPDVLAAMSRRGMQLVDGAGVDRVARALAGASTHSQQTLPVS